MSKKIVVGVDGSETASAAARKAAELAQAFGGELVVLSAYAKLEVETLRSGTDEFRFSSDDDSLKTAEQAAVAVRHLFPELTVTARAAEGRPADALVSFAEREDVDLIVVGNKRVQGLARVLGSIASDVASHAPCDVYVAHTHQR